MPSSIKELHDLVLLVRARQPRIAEELSHQLQQEGFRTVAASTPQEVQAALNLMGINMLVSELPKNFGSGIPIEESHLLVEIKKTHPELRVVFFSGNTDDLDVIKRHAREVRDYVIRTLFPQTKRHLRINRRIPLNQPLSWKGGRSSTYKHGEMKNISRRGAFVAAAEKHPEPGEIIDLEFYFEREDDFSLFQGLGIVRWSAPQGFGVEFVRLSPASRALIVVKCG